MGVRIRVLVLCWTSVVLVVVSSASYIFYTINNCYLNPDASIMACGGQSWAYLLGLVSLACTGIAVFTLAVLLSCSSSVFTKASRPRRKNLMSSTYVGQPDIGVLQTTEYDSRPALDPERFNDRPALDPERFNDRLPVEPGRLTDITTNIDIIIPRAYVYSNKGNLRY